MGSSGSSALNAPSPTAPRIALINGSATGLRRTLAIPGRVSSNEEICDPPSSAGTEAAAPRLKVAASYTPPARPSRNGLDSPVGGESGGRRGIKEFRAPEALALIASDRDHRPLVC